MRLAQRLLHNLRLVKKYFPTNEIYSALQFYAVAKKP